MKKFLNRSSSSKAKSDKETGDANRAALFGPSRPSISSQASVSSSITAPPPYDPYASVGPSTAPVNSRLNGPTYNRTQSASTEVQREELFRGAQPVKQPIRSQDSYTPGDTSGAHSGEEDRSEETKGGGDGDVEGIKQEMRYVKQESLGSTRNALRMAAQAEENGRATLTRLGGQSEMLSKTERDIDVSRIANRAAQEKTRELATLNRSMFAVHVNKPWGKNRRLESEENRVKQQFENDKNERDNREGLRASNQRRVDHDLKKHEQKMLNPTDRKKMSLAERSKYQFEADEEDDEIEGEIEQNLDQLAAMTGRLKGLAMATNMEVSDQNKTLDRLDLKANKFETDIFMSSKRLERIERM